jgi:hypothetical protein
MPSTPRRYVDATAIGAMFDVRPKTVREWALKGYVRAYRTPTGHLLFDPVEVEDDVLRDARTGGRIRRRRAS